MVKKLKYAARNVSTSGNLLRRSVRKAPAPSRTTIHTHGTSPSAPHQLSPLPKAIGAHTSASAAGLKMCSRWLRKIRLLKIAKLLVHARTSQDSSTDRMLNTNRPVSNALVGKRKRQALTDIQTPSIRHAATMAAARLGSSDVPPETGTAMASNTTRMTSI